MKDSKKIIGWNLAFFIFHYGLFLLIGVLTYDHGNALNLHEPQLFFSALCYTMRETLEINFTVSWYIPYHIVHVVVLEMWLFNVVKAQTFMKVLTFVTAILASAPMSFVLAFLRYRYF